MRIKEIRVEQGDSLQAIAYRELHDPTRWTELLALNDLALPFIVPSWKVEDRLAHTKIWGDKLLVPWESNLPLATPTSLFGKDLDLTGGKLHAADGDLRAVTGRDNIVQALSHRIRTLRNELILYPEYGCPVRLSLGLGNGPFMTLMAAGWVYESLKQEPRIGTVDSCRAEAQGDALLVLARVTLVGENTPVDLNLVVNP